jgi:hypothetical protein
MGGGLMQLVAYGAQDVYLTGNPQITFFKVVYRRHTNFAVENIEQVFNGAADFGRKVTCQISRNGDLITKMYLRVLLPNYDAGNNGSWAWVSRVGHALINSVELEIGGTRIDKQYGDWLNVWYELARNWAHDRGYDVMIGNTEALTTLATSHEQAYLYIPLKFFNNRNDGLAIPLIALQYHEVKINFEFTQVAKLINYQSGSTLTVPSMKQASLFVDYVYLDTEERKRFAQAQHEYLIEQLQFTGTESINSLSQKFRLNFNHPCKALYWTTTLGRYQGNAFLAYNPKNLDTTRLAATKRFVLSVCRYVSTTGLLDLYSQTVSTTSFTSGSLEQLQGGLQPIAAGGVNLINIFNRIKPIAIDDVPDMDNITILGDLLTIEEVSQPVSDVWKVYTTSKHEKTARATVLLATHQALVAVSSDGSKTKNVVVTQSDNYGYYLDRSGNPVSTVLLQLNGHDRFTPRDGNYFNYVQPYQHHANTPTDGLNMYSFALNPEEHQPSGTCNMSRIDNATLNLDFGGAPDADNFKSDYLGENSNINIYATNYNVLRIMSGMGGLAYSN